MRELSDDEVFGSGPAELSDDEVFGAPAPKARPRWMDAADQLMADTAAPTDPRISVLQGTTGDPGSFDFKKSSMSRRAIADGRPIPLPVQSDQALTEIQARDRQQNRKDFANRNPIVGGLAAGSAQALAGVANIPFVAADLFNTVAVNPILQMAGAQPLKRATAPGTQELASMADGFTAEVAKPDLGEAWDGDQFSTWMLSNLAQQAPQMAQSLVAAFNPALRSTLLPLMGGQSAGLSYAGGDDSRIAATKGLIEAGSEMLPLAAFDRVSKRLALLPASLQRQAITDAGKRAMEAGGALTVAGITGAIEESVAQLGGNAVDRFLAGKDVALSDGVGKAAVLGAAGGQVFGAPQAASALLATAEKNKQTPTPTAADYQAMMARVFGSGQAPPPAQAPTAQKAPASTPQPQPAQPPAPAEVVSRILQAIEQTQNAQAAPSPAVAQSAINGNQPELTDAEVFGVAPENVQDPQAPAAPVQPQAAPVEAPAPEASDAAPAAGVPDAGEGSGVRADGVTDGPGADAGNGFKRGPQEGERYRVGVSGATGGVSIEKRYPAGTVATFYVGKDGVLLDADNVNLVGTKDREKIWMPPSKDAADQATAILDAMGKLVLSDPKRADLKKQLKQLVAGAGDVQADGVSAGVPEANFGDMTVADLPKTPPKTNTSAEPVQKTAKSEQVPVSQPAQPVTGEGAGASQPTQAAPILQNRNRATPSSIAQMQSIAAKPDYGRLGFSRDFANGAPVVAGGQVAPEQLGRQDVAVASDGRRIPVQYAVVEASDVLPSNRADGTPNADYGNQAVQRIRAIAGNGRIAGLQQAYSKGTTPSYLDEMASDTLHGVSPDAIRRMRAPVLVRVMPNDQVSADIGDVSNTTGNLNLSAVEQASNDAQRVDLNALQFAEDGGITAETVRQFVRAMPQAEQGGLIDTNGQPTKQAVDRINAAVFAKAYGNDGLVRLFAQAQDPEARNVLSALAQVAPKMARLEGLGALDIRDVVTQAAEIAVNARRDGKPMAQAAQQLDMAADPLVGVVLDLFAASPRSIKPVVQALSNAADFAYTEGTKPAEDMFGAVPRASRADVINQLRPENERASQENLEQPAGSGPVQVDAGRADPQPAAAADPAAAQAGRPAQANDPGEALSSYTPQEVTQRLDKLEQAEAERKAADKAAAASEAKDRERADVKRMSEAAADTFELGGDAMANLTGQTDIFGAREEGQAYNAEAPRRPYTDDKQLQLFLGSEPDRSQTGPAVDRARREAVAAVDDLRSTESILAQALSSDYAARQRVSLVGQKITSAEDLAVLAQVYRDPRFETFRVVFLNDSGKVVSQVGLTSRLPASTAAIMGDDMGSYLDELSATARNRGASSYYLLHNHPSGVATASWADQGLTREFSSRTFGTSLQFRGHVVIDTNEYSVINGKGESTLLKKDFGQPAPYLAQEWGDANITGPADLMAMAKRLQVDRGAVTLIHTDSQFRVKAVTTIPASAVIGGDARKQVVKASLQVQGSQVFAVGRSPVALKRMSGFVRDAILVEDSGALRSLAASGDISGGQPFPENRRTRVSPDTSPEFAYLRNAPATSVGQRAAEPGRGTSGAMPKKDTENQGDAQQGADKGDAVTSKWFSEDNRLSNLSQTGASWSRIRENNPALRGKSVDDTITVFRATIGDSIRPDDYVAVDKSTLREELKNVRERDGSSAKVVSMQVKVRDLLMGNDATEFVFFPEQEPSIAREAVPQYNAKQGGVQVAKKSNRDALGRVKFRLGEVALGKLDAATEPLQVAFGMRMASRELRTQLRQMKATIEEANRKSVDVAKEMSAMSEADRAMVSDIVEKMIAPGVVPPEHAVKVADAITRTMDQQTDELVELGMLSKDSADRWRGRYLPRIYNRETELADDPLIKRLFKTGTPTMRGIGGGSLKGRGLFQDVSVDAADQWLAMGWEVRDPHWKLEQGKLELKDKNAPKVASDQVTVWRDWTPSERAQMGESRDAMLRFVKGYTSMQGDIALGRLFNNIANNTEWVRRSGADGWVKVPDTEVPDTGGVKRYGNLAGLWVRQDVMSHLSRFEESANDTLQLYREALGLWKEGKTALNPVAHFNNVVSNVSMAHFAGVSYWDSHKYVNAVRDMVNNAPMVEEARKVGLFTGSFTKEEMVQNMPPDLQKLMQQEEGATRKAGRQVMNALTFWLRQPMRDAYEFEDTFFKYLIYRDARQSGMDSSDAMDYALRYIFTYDDLPSGARKVRDYAIPFFSWTYKATPALLHTAMVYPWRLAAPAAVLSGINAVAYALAAGDEDDNWLEKLAKGRELAKEESEVLPERMQGTGMLGNKKTLRLGTDELTGLPIFLDASRLVPGGDMFDMVNQAGGLPLPAPIMPNHPVLSAFAAMIANKEMFMGREVVDKNDTGLEAAEKRAKWMAGFMLPAVAPGGYHSQRILDATANAMDITIKTPLGEFTGVDRSGLPVQPKYAAMQTIGLKARPVDLDLEAGRRKSQESALINSITAEVRSMARLHQRGAVSDEMMDRTREKAREKIEQMREDQ